MQRDKAILACERIIKELDSLGSDFTRRRVMDFVILHFQEQEEQNCKQALGRLQGELKKHLGVVSSDPS